MTIVILRARIEGVPDGTALACPPPGRAHPLRLDRRCGHVRGHPCHGWGACRSWRADRAPGAGVRLGRHNHLRCNLTEHPAGRPDRPVRRCPAPDDRPAPHRRGGIDPVADRSCRRKFCSCAMGALCDLGRTGRYRLRRGNGRPGDGCGQPVVCRQPRFGRRFANRQQCQWSAHLPASARHARFSSRLAERPVGPPTGW
jgi:hypothetical protein